MLNTFENAPTIVINGALIKQVHASKSLGVRIYENLSWTVHIETFSTKIASGIGAQKLIRYFVP